jgi:mannosyltransferase
MLVPTVLVAGYAVAVAPIYQPRYLTLTAPAAAIVIALGVRAIGRRWYVLLGATAYAACVLVVLFSQRTPFAKSGSDWSAVADVVAAEGRNGDAVYFAPRYTDQSDVIQMTTRRILVSYPERFEGLSDLTLKKTGAETATLDGFSRPLSEARHEIQDHDRVFGIFNQKSAAAERDESDDLFADLDYRARVVWDGPSTLVVAYTKSR